VVFVRGGFPGRVREVLRCERGVTHEGAMLAALGDVAAVMAYVWLRECERPTCEILATACLILGALVCVGALAWIVVDSRRMGLYPPEEYPPAAPEQAPAAGEQGGCGAAGTGEPDRSP